MRLTIVNAQEKYLQMLTLPEEERPKFFDEQILESMAPLFAWTGMPRDPSALGLLPLSGEDQLTRDMLADLDEADFWHTAEQAIIRASGNFRDHGILFPEEITLCICLGNPGILSSSDGYLGVGSLPGYIMITVAPNPVNIPRLGACIAHEFHHNVLFHNAKWNFMSVRLHQYLAVEGLAEALGVELYGEDKIGPWVTSCQGEDLLQSRKIIGAKLDLQGFSEVRPFMYGDHPAVVGGVQTGLPYCAGYAVGYHAVRAYIRRNNSDVGTATRDFLDGKDIVRLSGWFGEIVS